MASVMRKGTIVQTQIDSYMMLKKHLYIIELFTLQEIMCHCSDKCQKVQTLIRMVWVYIFAQVRRSLFA